MPKCSLTDNSPCTSISSSEASITVLKNKRSSRDRFSKHFTEYHFLLLICDYYYYYIFTHCLDVIELLPKNIAMYLQSERKKHSRH